MNFICSRLSSLASTARVRPISAAASTPARLWMLIWVLAWMGISGRAWRMARTRPKSWTRRASAPFWEARRAAARAASISRSPTRVFRVT